MSRIEELRQVTDQTLYALTADESLKYRILKKAAENVQSKNKSVRPIPVLCTACAVLMLIILMLNNLNPVSNELGDMNVFAAGSTEKPADSNRVIPLPEEIITDSVVSIELNGYGSVTDSDRCAYLIGILSEKASPAEGISFTSDDTLVFASDKGFVITLIVKKPYLTASDGSVWSCPEFFTELQNYIQ